MSEELIAEFDEALDKLQELARRFKQASEESAKLQILVTAMEGDQRKAARLIDEYEKMEKDRQRLKAKVSEVVEKLEKLRI